MRKAKPKDREPRDGADGCHDGADDEPADRAIDEHVLPLAMENGFDQDGPEWIGGGDALLQRGGKLREGDIREPKVACREHDDER